MKEPPQSVLPDPDTHAGWYPEFLLKYPLSETVCAQTYSHYFRAKCDLLRVMHRVAAHRPDNKDISSIPCVSQIASQYALELAKWYSSLKPALLPVNIVFPAQLKLQ